jgi:hypothetical protein
LGHPQAFRSAAEIQHFRNGTKISEMSQFQGRGRIATQLSPFNYEDALPTRWASPALTHE